MAFHSGRSPDRAITVASASTLVPVRDFSGEFAEAYVPLDDGLAVSDGDVIRWSLDAVWEEAALSDDE